MMLSWPRHLEGEYLHLEQRTVSCEFPSIISILVAVLILNCTTVNSACDVISSVVTSLKTQQPMPAALLHFQLFSSLSATPPEKIKR